ncbi:MAG: hypothetical protein AAF497_13950, partial [Planctomycetota bacterium]
MIALLKKIWWRRYAILTTLSPLLAVGAAYLLPSMLRGLLLMRTEPGLSAGSHSQMSLGQNDHWVLVSDLAWLTWMSAMVTALGLAIYRIIGLYGETRMLDRAVDINPDHEGGGLDYIRWHRGSTGWPLLPTLVWLFCSLFYLVQPSREYCDILY